MVTKVGIYLRVSSKKQEDMSSLRTQEQGVRAYLASNYPEAGVVRVYREVYSGAYLYDRPALTEAWHDMRDGEIDAFAVFSVDRLSRDGAHLVVIGQDCERYGVELLIVDQPLSDSPEAELLMYLKGWAAKIERRAIIERSMRAHLDRAKSGKLRPGYKPRYGYHWADLAKTHFEIYEPEALLVRRVFDLRDSGVNIWRVCKTLMEERVVSPGGAWVWRESTLYSMLTYEGYAGRGFTYRSTPNPIPLPDGVVPALINPAQFDRVQALMAQAPKQARRNNSQPENFLLRGHVFCDCGNRMWTEGAVGIARYYCPDNKRLVHLRTCRQKNQIDAGMLDREVWETVEGAMTDEGFWEGALGLVLGEEPRPLLDLDRIEARMRELERSRRKYLDAVAENEDPEDRAYYGLKLDSLKGGIGLLRAERDKLTSLSTERVLKGQHLDLLKGYSQEMASVVRERGLSYQEKRDALTLFDIHITVHPFSGKREKRWEMRGVVAPIGSGTACSDGTYLITFGAGLDKRNTDGHRVMDQGARDGGRGPRNLYVDATGQAAGQTAKHPSFS